MPLKITGKPAVSPEPDPQPKAGPKAEPEQARRAPEGSAQYVHLRASPREHKAAHGTEKAFSALCGGEGRESLLSFNVTCPECLSLIEEVRQSPEIKPRVYEREDHAERRGRPGPAERAAGAQSSGTEDHLDF